MDLTSDRPRRNLVETFEVSPASVSQPESRLLAEEHGIAVDLYSRFWAQAILTILGQSLGCDVLWLLLTSSSLIDAVEGQIFTLLSQPN